MQTKTNFNAPIIEKLDQAGFFAMTAPEHIEKVKEGLLSGNYPWYEDALLELEEGLCSIDHRYIFIDGEELHESGPIPTLELLKLTLERIKLELNYSKLYDNDCDDDPDDPALEFVEDSEYEGWRRTIIINNQEYLFHYDFDQWVEEVDTPWLDTYIIFIYIMNDVLQKLGSKERLYAVKMDNDGGVMLLTPEMKNILEKELDHFVAMETEEFLVVQGVHPTNAYDLFGEKKPEAFELD